MSTTQEKGQRYSVLVSCTLHDGKTDEYLAIMEKVIAYLSKEEPDFLHIEIMRVDGSPNKLRYLEHWAKPFDVLAKVRTKKKTRRSEPILDITGCIFSRLLMTGNKTNTNIRTLHLTRSSTNL